MNATLYDYAISGNGWKVRTLLRWLGLPFSLQWVDLLAGEQDTPAFRALNPSGQIPVLKTGDGRVLRESSAILIELGEGTALLPHAHRHDVTAWLSFEQTWIDGIVSRARFRRLHPDAIPTPEVFFDAWLSEGTRGLQILERHLLRRSFMVNEAFSLADIGLYAYVHCAEEGGFDLQPLTSVRQWLARVAEQPCVRALDDNPEAPPP